MYAELAGARIFFDTVGSQLGLGDEGMLPRPTLIALHGGPGSDHSGLRPYFDRFADTCQVLYVDHRGNGRSSGEASSWTLQQWGADLKALCDLLGIEKPIVYGNSFGGMVAMSYAAQFPDHPAGLILSSTAARLRLDVSYAMMEAKGGPRARQLAERLFTEADEAVMAEYRAVCLPLYNPCPDPQDGAISMRALLRGDVARHFFLGEMRTMDGREGLGRIACPTLVLAGAHDPITPLACSEEIVASLPPGLGRIEVFPDAGHGVHRDDPQQAETAIRTFLASIV
ncbi:MAG: alpha/beta hydrolase [Proteobacteria bacterium]|nr:alpha/beta hydrolase [Pseudomonadota bacterium]